MTESNTNEHAEYIEGSKQSIVIKLKTKKKADIVGDSYNTLWLGLVSRCGHTRLIKYRFTSYLMDYD